MVKIPEKLNCSYDKVSHDLKFILILLKTFEFFSIHINFPEFLWNLSNYFEILLNIYQFADISWADGSLKWTTVTLTV